MLRDIIKKEILDNITSPKFVFTFLLCTILILLSVYTGVSNYRAEKKEYTAALALNKKNMEAQPNYQSLAGIGIKISKPPQVLGTVVNGIEEAVGRVAPVNIAADPNLIDSKYSSNPVFAVFGALDLMFIVKIVLSLFAILFTYDAIVGEKEKGTLKLALSNDVPRDRLILGKAIGGYISLLLPLLVPLLLSLLVLLIMPDISLERAGLGPADAHLPHVLPLPLGLLQPGPVRLGPDLAVVDELPRPPLRLGHHRHGHPQGRGHHRRPDQADPLGPRDHGQEGRLPPADPERGPEGRHGVDEEEPGRRGQGRQGLSGEIPPVHPGLPAGADVEDRREQRRGRAGLSAEEEGPAEPGRQSLPDLAGLGPDLRLDDPGPHRGRRVRPLPGLGPGLQAHLHEVDQLQARRRASTSRPASR